MNNIIEKHISKTQKKLKKYCTMILKSKYDRNVADELIQTYIDARYYNYGVDENIRFFYRKIFEALKVKAEKLIKQDKSKKEIVENTLMLFQYFFYFDNVRNNVEVEEIIKSIAEKRISQFHLRSAENDDFVNEFTKLVKDDIKEVNDNLELYDSKDFELEIKKINPKNNIFYYAKLRYNFGFPEIFSDEIIESTFNTDIIAEDKLFVEYPMIANKALKDILEGNFDKVYVIDFAVELLKKKKKLDQLLEILDNQAAQDKICFEITYEDFLNNKTEIFKLIKNGFGFALVTNSEMPKFTNDELKIFEIFDCILVDTNDINKKKYKKNKIIEL